MISVPCPNRSRRRRSSSMLWRCASYKEVSPGIRRCISMEHTLPTRLVRRWWSPVNSLSAATISRICCSISAGRLCSSSSCSARCSNCAAVIHGINRLWSLGLDLTELCRLGAELGSDVPFCVMGQAAADPILQNDFDGDPLACHCAEAVGRGTELRPVPGLRSDIVLSKPPISVSTAEAYQGVDHEEIPERPDVEEMVVALGENDINTVQKNMINVLENFTLKRYSIVVYTKNKMQDLCKNGKVLMSGSGPTVFGLCESREEAKRISAEMQEINRESFWTRTTW